MSKGCSFCNVVANLSFMSSGAGSSPFGRDQSKQYIEEAKINGSCLVAIGCPGHILFPEPKDLSQKRFLTKAMFLNAQLSFGTPHAMDLISLQNQGLKSLLWRMMELGAAPNVADFYPTFAGLDPQGIRREISECLKEMFGIWEIYIKERREERHANAHNTSNTDFLGVFLSNGLDDDQINWLVIELFSAGVDTPTTTVEWAIAELLKNKQAMKTLQQELETKINRNPIQESQVSQLPYLTTCVKETLRLHPPAPLMIPHCSTEACELMNFIVPKNTRVLVNAWAIGRDPLVWEDSELFKPERFLDSSLDFKTQNFNFLPFGSGRRMCPGLPMATRQLPLILASLIHCFDWSLPNGEDPALLDMNDKFGITLQKEQPLLIVPKRKL
ncbi:hypothetical protein JCGZ_11058 [Jatropha curcas]|uniref:Uncharacterized protein n=1 Tax=Jatropha curcas TaxID=180498 RepID=A0A067KHL0_JATCU|nr:hypothetical protein JCGZ_11058 [Jatropha curcas]